MKRLINKFLFPVLLVIISIFLILVSFTANQNSLFLLGGISILIMSVLSILQIMEVIGKTWITIVYAVLIITAIALAALDYKSIKDPIDFQNEKEKRYDHVIQRLKDIRTIQLAFKAVKGKYAESFDSLLYFVNNDSFPVIKAIGTVPDTLTENEAVKRGLVYRDTSYVSVKDSIFSKRFLMDRKLPFYIDSIPYVPYASKAIFDMQAGETEIGNVKVNVFQVTDSKPFDLSYVLSVGSMTQASTSGNWGE